MINSSGKFKIQHATDMCIFTVKSVIKLIRSGIVLAVYQCFLVAAKAFDRVSHWTLFSKMIKRNVPLIIVRIVAFWYQTRTICVKWGKLKSLRSVQISILEPKNYPRSSKN